MIGDYEHGKIWDGNVPVYRVKAFLSIKPLEILGAAAFMRWLPLAFYPYPTLTGIFRSAVHHVCQQVHLASGSVSLNVRADQGVCGGVHAVPVAVQVRAGTEPSSP